jgi:hypothetical protein
MSRPTLWRWKPVYEALPGLSREQLKIPAKSLYLIAMNVRETVREEVLAIAAADPKMGFEKLSRLCQDQGYIGKPVEDGANFILTGSKEQIRELRQLVENPKIVEYVGTPHVVEILLAALHEALSSGWPQ